MLSKKRFDRCNELLPKALNGDKKAIKEMAKQLRIKDVSILTDNLKVVNINIDKEAERLQVPREVILERYNTNSHNNKGLTT